MERTSSCCCCRSAISTMTANTIVLANGVGVSHRVSWWKYQSTYCLPKHFLCKERRSQMLFSQNRSTLQITVNIISVRARIVSMKVSTSWHSDMQKQRPALQHCKSKKPNPKCADGIVRAWHQLPCPYYRRCHTPFYLRNLLVMIVCRLDPATKKDDQKKIRYTKDAAGTRITQVR
jgi:hypothetical protein